MSRKEWFQKYSESILEGLDLGIISTTVMAKWIQYQVFIQQRSTHKTKRQAILTAAELQKCDEKTIRRAIQFFE